MAAAGELEFEAGDTGAGVPARAATDTDIASDTDTDTGAGEGEGDDVAWATDTDTGAAEGDVRGVDGIAGTDTGEDDDGVGVVGTAGGSIGAVADREGCDSVSVRLLSAGTIFIKCSLMLFSLFFESGTTVLPPSVRPRRDHIGEFGVGVQFADVLLQHSPVARPFSAGGAGLPIIFGTSKL